MCRGQQLARAVGDALAAARRPARGVRRPGFRGRSVLAQTRADVYLLALERLGLGPGQAVAIEDTPHGVAAAKAAGLACIAIPNPFVEAARLAAADLVLSSAADLTLAAALEMLHGGSREPSPGRR